MKTSSEILKEMIKTTDQMDIVLKQIKENDRTGTDATKLNEQFAALKGRHDGLHFVIRG